MRQVGNVLARIASRKQGIRAWLGLSFAKNFVWWIGTVKPNQNTSMLAVFHLYAAYVHPR